MYDRRSTEALIPSVGVNDEGSGEVFRLNLEVGRFMKGYQVDVGNEDALMSNNGLQGDVGAGSVNCASVAEGSHNLLAFGTSLGTIEFWDPRSRSRVGILSSPRSSLSGEETAEISCLEFHATGLSLASGASNGLIHLYDLRSPVPLLKKDQGYGYPIQNLTFLDSSTMSKNQSTEPRIMSSDKRIIKIWDARDGNPWTSIEPAVDLNHVTWVPDSGMFLTANEGRQQHSFFIPQLGPAPKWCAFLDNLVEEMAEDGEDPSAFGAGGVGRTTGEVYDNYKFLTMPQLRQLNMDHLVGTTSLLRPYMHGYFVAQKLYEEARLISNPDMWAQQRAKSVKERIDKERESRIRGSKKVKVKVNRKLAERLVEREEKKDRWLAKKVLAKGADPEADDDMEEGEEADQAEQQAEAENSSKDTKGVLNDPRFARLFQDEDFEVDETSYEFRALNPSTVPTTMPETKLPKGLTAVEREEIAAQQKQSNDSSDSDSEESDEDDEDQATNVRRKPSTNPTKRSSNRRAEPEPRMLVSSSSAANGPSKMRGKSFGARAVSAGGNMGRQKGPTGARANGSSGGIVGEREITFTPSDSKKHAKNARSQQGTEGDNGRERQRGAKDRRSASGNVFRRM